MGLLLDNSAWRWALFFVAVTLGAQAPAKLKTVLDGIYTPAQAARGKAAFEASCALCHKADLTGFSAPPLKGALFLDRWREFPANILYDLIRTTMPKEAGAPLEESRYLDIFAYILQANEIPPGASELTPQILPGVLLVGKDGPKPLPSSAQVAVTGCLKLEVGTGWFLINANDPVRTLDGFEITPAEADGARKTHLGASLLRLQNITDLPNLELRDVDNTRVQVKGILVRQQNGERVNVTALKSVSPVCAE